MLSRIGGSSIATNGFHTLQKTISYKFGATGAVANSLLKTRAFGMSSTETQDTFYKL